jgi:RHS repeat-associated protein
LGRRVAHTVGSTTTVFVQAGQQTIADYASGAAPASSTYRYIYGSYIDEPVMRWQTSNSTPVYYHRTQQYSITAITSSTGSVLERYAYSAYGVPTIANASGTALTSSAISNRYTYTGREWDNDIKQYHYRARMYDASLGRFCGRDPIGYRDGLSLSASFQGLSNMDPTGLRKVCCNFKFGWVIPEYETKELDCHASKSAAECCDDYGAFPRWWTTTNSANRPCKRPECVTYRALKLVPFATAVSPRNCSKVLPHPGLQIVLTLAIANECYIDHEEWDEDEEYDHCKEEYKKCLKTVMSTWGGKQRNRCWKCRLACNARGSWYSRMNRLDCAYWNTGLNE